MPDGISYVVTNKHGAIPVDDYAHGSSFCLSFFAQEPCQQGFGSAFGLSRFAYVNSDHLVTTRWVTVPRAALRNDGMILKTRDCGVRIESETKRCGVGAQCIVRDASRPQ